MVKFVQNVVSQTQVMLLNAKFATHQEWLAASAHAHYIWYYFAAVGLVAALTLVVFSFVTKRIDAKKESEKTLK